MIRKLSVVLKIILVTHHLVAIALRTISAIRLVLGKFHKHRIQVSTGLQTQACTHQWGEQMLVAAQWVLILSQVPILLDLCTWT
jgi:hypothetical protein